jgi:hypothetical protein
MIGALRTLPLLVALASGVRGDGLERPGRNGQDAALGRAEVAVSDRSMEGRARPPVFRRR